MKIKVSSDSLTDLCEEGLVLELFCDERPPRGLCGIADWHLNGLISRLIAGNRVTGSFMEQTLIHPQSNLTPPKILLVGMGSVETLSFEELYQAGSTVITSLAGIKCQDFASQIPGTGRCGMKISRMAFAFFSGLFDTIQSSPPGSSYDPHIIHILAEAPYRADIAAGIGQCPAVIENRIPVVTDETNRCAVGGLSR